MNGRDSGRLRELEEAGRLWEEFPYVRVAGRHPVGDRSSATHATAAELMEHGDAWDWELRPEEQDFEAIIVELEETFEVPFAADEARAAYAAGKSGELPSQEHPYLSPAKGGVCCAHVGFGMEGCDLAEGIEAWAEEYPVSETVGHVDGLGGDGQQGAGRRVWLVAGKDVDAETDRGLEDGGVYVVATDAMDVTEEAARVLRRMGVPGGTALTEEK